MSIMDRRVEGRGGRRGCGEGGREKVWLFVEVGREGGSILKVGLSHSQTY